MVGEQSASCRKRAASVYNFAVRSFQSAAIVDALTSATVSSDGKLRTLMVNGTISGKKFEYTAVYDKE